jgi:thiol:disulfide interchange protein DsbC
MISRLSRSIPGLCLLCGLLAAVPARAQEDQLRKVLTERLPQMGKIDEITRSPVPGLFEVRFGGTGFLYSDAKGDFVFVNGSLMDTKTRTDLTDAKLQKLLAIDFDKLPLKDAMVFRQGSGTRRMAVFVDPNCGFCKRFEHDLVQLKDVTIYTFLIPILGDDSVRKAHDIWCAREPSTSWRAWMLDGVVPARVMGRCDTAALDRNLEFARVEHVNGTPGLFFADGSRKSGAIPRDEVEKLLVAADKPADKPADKTTR